MQDVHRESFFQIRRTRAEVGDCASDLASKVKVTRINCFVGRFCNDNDGSF